MSKYNEQYYLAFDQCDENGAILFLQLTDDSDNRDPCLVELNVGEQPLFLEDASQEIDIYPTKAHMNMQRLVVDNDLYLDLVDFDINNFQLYPAVIIDRDEKYHDGYWLFNIYDSLHAVDYHKSEIRDYDPNRRLHQFIRYSFSDETLDAIPEDERLIFRIAGSNRGHIAYHQKIVDIFNNHNVGTIKFMRISDWVSGSEFRKRSFW